MFENCIIEKLNACLLVDGGILYATDASYSRQMAKTEADIEAQAVPGAPEAGPIAVDAAICHYIIPNGWLDSSLNWVLCPSCFAEAEKLRARYDASIADGSFCARRGTNLMRFQAR